MRSRQLVLILGMCLSAGCSGSEMLSGNQGMENGTTPPTSEVSQVELVPVTILPGTGTAGAGEPDVEQPVPSQGDENGAGSSWVIIDDNFSGDLSGGDESGPDNSAPNPGEPAGTVVQNFSGFEQFRCVQRSEIVPCLPVGSIYEVVIRRQGYANYLAEISVVQQGVVGQDACINSPATYVCAKAEAQEPRLLEAGEIAAVQAAFRAVEVELGSEPGCDPDDDCGVTAFSWDEFEVDDSCKGPRLPPEQARVLGEVLEQLRSAGQDGEAGVPEGSSAPVGGVSG